MRHQIAVFACAAGLSLAQLSVAQVTLRREIVAGGLTQPCGISNVPGDSTRMIVVQRSGQLRMVNLTAGTTAPTPFLSVPNVLTDGERGLVGLALHPQYAANGYFYFYYIRSAAAGAETVLARGHRSDADPNIADAAITDILVLPNAQSFHQSGWTCFGPDGYLYLSIGDNTHLLNGQDLTILRGKILRLDVDGPDNIPATADDDAFPADPAKNYAIPPGNPFVGIAGEDEIFLFGFRNPFRCSFDRETGDLWIGEVGSEYREEVDFVPAGTNGWDMGWPCMEGHGQLVSCVPIPPYMGPLFDFGFEGLLPIGSQDYAGFRYVIGGYVYRGSAMPCLRGTYFFADGASGIYSIRRSATGQVTELTDRRLETSELKPTAFGESLDGELYAVHIGDPNLYRLVFDSISGTDCDSDGVPDACAISLGWTTDTNTNSIPDRCEGLCTDIDFNNDGLFPDTADISDYLSVFAGAGCPTAHCDSIDFNNDTLFPDTLDIQSFLSVFSGGPCL